MDNRLKIYVAVLILIFIGIGFVEVNRPREIDWRPHYTTSKKTPYGLYVLDKEMRKIFADQKIEKLDLTPYEYFNNFYDYDSLVSDYSIRGSYFSVENNSILDQESAIELLTFVSRGNEAFLSANSLSRVLLDSLDLVQGAAYGIKDQVVMNLEYVDSSRYSFDKINYVSYFDSINSDNLDILGYIEMKLEDTTLRYVNYVRIGYGNGSIFLHSTPNVFTNYHLLKNENHLYASGVLSFIQNRHPIYYNSNDFERAEKGGNHLRVILEHDSLRWAWYFLWIGFLVYLIFNAKRKQRIIPIIPPVLNTTVDFTKTISNMYFQEGHYKTVMEKRIIYFLERVRTEFHLDTQNLDDKFKTKLQLKSGRPKNLIEKIVKKIANRKLNRYLSENDLVELNGLLEEFWIGR
jgi:hypothetical protein